MRGTGGGRPPNTVEKVLARIDRSGGPDACWPWTGYRNRQGYGETTIQRKPLRVHRVAWEAEHGPIPDGMALCHSCDNPPCCNPRHHFVGTTADNNADMRAKGRAKADTHGAKHGTHSGYIKHVRDRSGEWSMPACRPCLDATAAYGRSRS